MTPNPETPDTRVTVRDLYACAALTGILANPSNVQCNPERTTGAALHYADAALARR
jgi:hypothetical protein